MDFVMSYSGGKDSALALARMVDAGHNCLAIISNINIELSRSWFHGISKEMLQVIADSLNVKLILCESTPEEYERKFEEGLLKGKAMGATACAFGDIDLINHRTWNEDRCNNSELECMLPLWNENRESLVDEVISKGFKAKIKVVDLSKLDKSYLGRDLSKEVIADFKKANIDVCGENGEYHTLVYDGPIFNKKIDIKTKEIITSNGYSALDITVK
jgi:uncharacterized protein (TIGR00290 family)